MALLLTFKLKTAIVHRYDKIRKKQYRQVFLKTTKEGGK